MIALYLDIDATTFERVASGGQTEIYRSITPYWICRMMHWETYTADGKFCQCDPVTPAEARRMTRDGIENYLGDLGFYYKCFDTICLTRRDTDESKYFDLKGIVVGKGRPEWGAAKEASSFIISIGQEINLLNK